jgi:hypothetical protein
MQRRHFLVYISAATLAAVLDKKTMRIIWQNTAAPVFWPISPATSDRVFYGGITEATMANNGTLGGGAGAVGRTFIQTGMRQRIRQHGYIRTIKMWVAVTGTGTPYKFKVLRPNVAGTRYDFVAESDAFLPVGAGIQTYSFSTSMPCQPGDCIGVWLAGNNNLARIAGKTLAGSEYGYVDEDVATSVEAAALTVGADFVLNLEVTGIPPFVAITGDSIPEGHNTTSQWHGAQHGGFGPAGNLESEPGYWLRLHLGGASMLEYQNVALGSQTYAWVRSSAIAACLAALPQAILIHCGVNDVGAARTWSAVLADLNAIRAAIPGSIDLFIDEILPWTAGSDTQAATIRTWNVNLAAWCSANNAILVRCHDAMGQIRPSTGQLDDLLAEYNYDGLHLSKAGVMRLAQLCAEGMNDFYA